MPSEDCSSRRRFLEASLGAASAGLLAGPSAQSADQVTTPPPLGDLPRETTPTGSDLGSLAGQVAKWSRANEYAYSFLGDRFATLDEFKSQGREKVFETMLYRPEPVDPAAEVLDRADMGDHVREKILFSTAPDFRVPAYVLIPKGLTGPAPAIVDLHSHGGMYVFGKEKVVDLGRNHPAMSEYHRRVYDGQPTSTALVRRGYVVIAIDAFYFGERRFLMDDDLALGWDRSNYSLEDVKRLNRTSGRKETTLVKSLVFAGLTWPGVVFRDDIRTVDYLVTRPEVDPKRIGCMGISMGGHRTLTLAGLDDRIRAAVVAGFMSTVRPMIHAHIDTHSWVHFLPTLHRYLDLPDVVSMMAPGALMVQQCSQDDLFPLDGMKESVEKIAAVYRKAQASDRFSGRFYDIPHRFSRAMQADAFDWLDRHLKA